ncbi:hypothetical protein [Lactobacillus sp. LL6]|uniref:hypothetical protein n=1 Tax=Lactobacillus sp. LL6 TaxID=2596827 RepID=UPI001185CA1B|nr:hypothetical protein [Lactobacillus sp. LL6]TSO26937.1 hypothetical protein FOD82_07920 [Lactobacillus sp. LL6]
MNYLKFQIKKVTKNNLIIITVGLLIVLSFVVLILNKNAATQMSLESEAYGNQALQQKNIKESKADLKNFPKNSERYKVAQEDLTSNEAELEKTNTLIKELKNKNWEKVYKIKYSNLLKADKYTFQDKSATQTEKFYLNKNLALFAYLKRHPLPYQTDPPSEGYMFLTDLNQLYLPIIFSVIAVFMLTQLYTSSYKNKVDIDSLIPLQSNKKILYNSLSGVIIVGFIYILVNLLVFIGSSILFGTGSIDYPFYIYTSESAGYYTPVRNIFMPSIILSFLGIGFIVVMMQLISKLLKDQLPTLFIGIVLLVGFNMATAFIVPLKNIAPYLPTTYLNSIKTVSGELAFQIGNFNVNYTNGVISLFTGIVIASASLQLLNLKNK